jgi:hypothetical protein
LLLEFNDFKALLLGGDGASKEAASEIINMILDFLGFLRIRGNAG